MGNYDKAEEYFKQAISALGRNVNVPFAYNGLGKISKRRGKFDEAFKYHNEALARAEELSSKTNILRSLDGIANVYDTLKDYRSALRHYQQALTLAKEIGYKPDMKDLYEEVATAYAHLNDFPNAFKYHKLYSGLKDTLYDVDIDKKLGRLQFQFDLDKKEGQLALVTKDKALTDQK